MKPHSHLIFDKGGKKGWRKDCLFKKWWWEKLVFYMQIPETRFLSLILYKNQFQIY
jgi:hypothetical protein